MTGGTVPRLAPRCGSCGAEVPDPSDLRKVRTARQDASGLSLVCKACLPGGTRPELGDLLRHPGRPVDAAGGRRLGPDDGRRRAAGGTVRTDGAALLSLLRVGPAAGEQIVAASRLSTAFRQYRAGESLTAGPEVLPADRTDPVILGIEGTRRILTGKYDEALVLLREAVSLPQEDDVLALSLNNLAWVLLLTEPDGWLEEADRASERALSLKPWMEPLMGTRGCVLTHRVEFADARHLLQRAVQGDTARQVRLVLYRHLFRAEHGLGNLYGARAALLALVDNGAEPEELDSARALLRPWEVDNALANLVGADGVIEWPDARGGDTQARHVAEMRHAVTAFVQDAGDDPRLEAVRLALG